MRQVIQYLDTGSTELVDAPAPRARPGTLVIATRVSMISAGTERMLVDFGKAGWLAKARKQPEKVRMVVEKARTDGLLTTIESVRSKLRQPLPLGYCNVGEVIEIGAGVSGFAVGDRVVSNGPHAEIIRVPKNLCARVPDNVDDESASSVVVASIALQGLRLAAPTLGESFVVTGAGLIGLLAVQLLRAQGCRVLAIDLDDEKLAIAKSFGAEICNPSKGEDPVERGLTFSRGRGVDGVIVTAATKSSEPITHAARMSRKRGRIVLVGVTGLNLDRADFYEKELSFQVSCSYGPGRYDPLYEEGGQDYPIGFVRWTEQRNFEAVLDLLASGSLDVRPLATHRFTIDDAAGAYRALSEDSAALGILLEYRRPIKDRLLKHVKLASSPQFDRSKPIVGVIGAGNYASRVLIPAFRKAGAQLQGIATSGGVASAVQGRAAGFAEAGSSAAELIADDRLNTVVIATRHDSHAQLTADALAAGKHVFVEKPLSIDREGLEAVRAAYDQRRSAGEARQLMVGFNRRFAPHVLRAAGLLRAVPGPKSFIMTMNAGAIPASHWTQDPLCGGRIVGEACHLIDLVRHLAGSPITNVMARAMSEESHPRDTASITLSFADGSIGTIHYFANGHASFPKERIEIFAQGRVLQIDNFVRMRGFGWPGVERHRLFRQDKGQTACAVAFLRAIETGEPAIPVDELFEVAEATLDAAEQLRGR